MKFTFICFILVVLATFSSLSQQTPKFKKPETREQYLSRSKAQRTAAWIFLGAGIVGIAAVAPGNSSFGTTGTVVVLSGLSMLTSLPLFIAARRNKKRGLAMPISLHIQNNPAQFARLTQLNSPALSLKISLSRSFKR